MKSLYSKVTWQKIRFFGDSCLHKGGIMLRGSSMVFPDVIVMVLLELGVMPV